MKKIFPLVLTFLFFINLPRLYLTIGHSKDSTNQEHEEPRIIIKNETTNEICAVNLEDPNQWPPFISTSFVLSELHEKIQRGEEYSIIGIVPGTHDLYIVDCSGRLIYEEIGFSFQEDRLIIVKEPAGPVQIQNNSQNPVCYISIMKYHKEYSNNPYYDWTQNLDVGFESSKQINLLPGTYSIKVIDCDGVTLSRAEEMEVSAKAKSKISIEPMNMLKISYDANANREICFLYISSMNNPSIGDDVLSIHFISPGNIATVAIPDGIYKIFAQDCYGGFIYQEGNITISDSNELDIYIPNSSNLLIVEETNELSICELYVSPNIETFTGADLSSYIGTGISLTEGYYDIQINYCNDQYLFLEKPQLFSNIYISGNYKFVPSDPRPLIYRYLMNNPNQVRWLIIATICGICGAIVITPILIFIFWRKRHRSRRTDGFNN